MGLRHFHSDALYQLNISWLEKNLEGYMALKLSNFNYAVTY